MSACPKCGRRVDRLVRFCPDCGADLKGGAPPAPLERREPHPCKACGRTMDGEVRFCPDCGADHRS